jgi:hypothetical protein
VSTATRRDGPAAPAHPNLQGVSLGATRPASASASVAAVLAHVDALHTALGDLLDLPVAQACGRRRWQ